MAGEAQLKVPSKQFQQQLRATIAYKGHTHFSIWSVVLFMAAYKDCYIDS